MSTQTLQKLKFQARQLYKELHYLGRSYPDPSYRFHEKLRGCFGRHCNEKIQGNEQELRRAIEKAEFVKKEIEALYFLKKYRAMLKRYPDSEIEGSKPLPSAGETIDKAIDAVDTQKR